METKWKSVRSFLPCDFLRDFLSSNCLGISIFFRREKFLILGTDKCVMGGEVQVGDLVAMVTCLCGLLSPWENAGSCYMAVTMYNIVLWDFQKHLLLNL